MSSKSCAAAASALGVFALAPAALADVTAEQVWSDWRGYMADAGYAVKATEERVGDTLSITDLAMTLDIPEDSSTVTMTMGEFSFADNGDGTVSIVLPSDLPIGVSVGGDDSEEADIGLNYATKGLSINVSGDPQDMTYTYSAASAGLALTELVVEGEPVDMAEFGTVEMTIANIAGSTRMQVDELRRSVQKVTTGAVSYLVDVNEPEGGDGHVLLRGGADGMDIRADVSLPEDMDPEQLDRMLAAGFAVDGSIAIEGGNSSFDFEDGDDVAQGSSSTSGSSLRVAMDDGRLAYAGDVSDLDVSMAGGDLPFPVDVAMQQAGFNVEMPISSGEEERDFALGLTLRGFTMSDMLWGIFDPGGQLPRDPATVAFDITGAARLLVDLLDPEQMQKASSGETMPAEITRLEINDIQVSAAGASLTGAGGFTFDNTDLETFQGVPAPSGEVNLKLVGGNALLDKLVGMGLVPEDEASGMRMMMGLFAVPAEGEDTLTSKIEVKDNGQVLANGQRIQ